MASTLDQIENLGLLIALSVAASLFTRRHTSQTRYALMQGALLGAVAVAGMMDAMALGVGVQFDARSVAISLCGLQFGPGAALVAAAMAGICRVLQGGAGVPMGLAGIAAAAAIGSLFYRWRDREAGPLSNLQLLAFGLVVHGVVFLTTFLLPVNTALEVLPQVAPYLLVAFPLATVVVGRILAAEEGRRHVVDALSKSEAQFRATLYSIGDAVVTTDGDGLVRHMNSVAEQLTGWTEMEARGRALDEICVLVDEASRLGVENPALRALREGNVSGLAGRVLLIARDGAEHPISDSGAVIRGVDGVVGGVVLVFRNQGMERAAEQALRYSEERFARALEHIPDVVVIYDTDLRIQYINEATRRVTGRPASDFLGSRDDEVWPPEVYEPYLPALQSALATAQTEALEIALDLPESGTRHLQITCIPMVDGAGRVCEVMGITHDFTEQYRAAIALSDEERRFHTVFNQQFQFMVLLNPEGRILEINDVPLRAGGVSREDVVGQVFWDATWWRDLPSMRSSFPKRLEAACLAQSPVFSIDEYQVATGEIRTAETSITAVRDDSGELQYYIVQASDITEKQRAREDLLATNNLLEGTFDSMTEAVLVIDYDQRTIVRSNAAVSRVFGYTQAELDGQNTSLLHIDSEHYTRFGRESGAVLASGKPYSVEYPMRRKDGTVFPTEITVRTIHVSRGWKMGVVSVVRDISLRKQAEDALRESEALLRIAGHAARIGGWYVDVPNGRVIWSEEARAIHEAPPEEWLSAKEAVSTYAPGSRERVAAAFQKCVESGTPYDLELELITHRGRRTWVRVIGQAIRGADGQIFRVQGALQDIDEQKQIENTLAESQQKFQQLADAMPLIVWTALPDGSLDFANRALALYTGRSPAAGADELWLESMHAEDRARFQDACQSAIRAGVPFAHELRLLRHDGAYRWHQTHGLPIRDGGGRVVKWYGTAADVHDSKLNEARLARTLESITDAFYTLDRGGRFTYLNAEAERLQRRSRDELLGRVAVRVFPEMLKNEVSRYFLCALRDNSTVEFETFYAPFKQWFEVHAYPSEEGLAVYFRDITERLEAEQQMRALSARLQSILDFSPLLMTELDIEGRYLLANKAVCEFLGRRPEDILGKHLRDILTEDAAEHFQERLASVQRRGKSIQVEDEFEIGGVKRYFSTMLFPLFDREGAVISIGGIAQEVSDRKRAEAERETLEEQLRQVQKMDAIGRLAGGVAHDFNNMLGVILGFTDMAIEALPADHEAVHDLAQVRAAATHSAELTRQLLAFARKQATAPEVLNLNDAVGSVLKMLGRLIGEDIALIWRPGLNLGPVRLDPTQLDQILANLAVNARDAIHGVGKLVIETEGVMLDALFCEQHPGFLPGRYVLLSVSDDGCGMTHETQTQIFEPFFTTKPLGSGTGLGLSTVYGIVKQNNGFINVNSEPGKGSTFRIYLPYFVTTDESRSGHQKPVEPHGGSETVLLVEDEVGLLELGRRLLDRLGYVVIAANGSTQALAASAEYKGPIDLLVTDVIMPDMNGRDLWLRLQADRPGIKSLFMSGYTADVIAHQGALEEGVHFLQKPFTMDAFATKLREALK